MHKNIYKIQFVKNANVNAKRDNVKKLKLLLSLWFSERMRDGKEFPFLFCERL
jgi:hypothetical protein